MKTFKEIYLEIIPEYHKDVIGFTDEEYHRKIRQFLIDFQYYQNFGYLYSLNSVNEAILFLSKKPDDYTKNESAYMETRKEIIGSLYSWIRNKPSSYYLSIASSTEIKADKHTRVLFSEPLKKFQIITNEKKLGKMPILSRPYDLSDVWEYELICDSTIQVKNSRGIGNAIVGGILFGPIGAVAGAMISGSKTKEKNKYAVRLSLNDMELASIEIPCESREIASRLMSTFSVFENRVTSPSDLAE